MNRTNSGPTPIRTITNRSAAVLLAHLAGASVGLAQNDDPPSVGLAGFNPGPSTDRDPSELAADRAARSAQPGRDPMGKGSGKLDIKVDSNQLVDLTVKDEDLANVLEMLSIQSQRNIIASKDVSASVTANFYGVTFYQALDAILHANGFGYVEKDNFIYVYTAEQLKAIMDDQRVRMSKVVRLNYINAIDAAEFVKAALSDGGQIKTPGKTAPFPGKSDVPNGADEYSNDAILVITDYEENIKAIEELLQQIDTRPAQVLVEATILQASLNEANAFGVDFALIADANFNDFVGIGGPLKTVDGIAANNSEKLTGASSGNNPASADGRSGGIVSNPGNINGPATLKMGFIWNDVSAFIRVLDEVTDTTILSNPKIMALNRQPARVLVGQRVGYLNTTSTNTATTQTVEFLDTGTQLHFRPFVSEDRLIRMELKPQVSTAVVREVKNSSGAVVTVPDEITNELTTNVIVGDGQTVVLGGLFRDKTQTTRRQVPFFGDIPILGEAFRGHDNSVERNEIIFLITPSIVNDQAMIAAGKRGSEMIDKVRTGSREQLLPFSRERRSTELLVEAERLAKAGDTQKAIWKLEQSLTMNPIQPDALRLKERLTGEKTTWPHRSMLEDIMRREQGLPQADANDHDTFDQNLSTSTDTTNGTVTSTSDLTQKSIAAEAAASTTEAQATETATTTPATVTTNATETPATDTTTGQVGAVQGVEAVEPTQDLSQVQVITPDATAQPEANPATSETVATTENNTTATPAAPAKARRSTRFLGWASWFPFFGPSQPPVANAPTDEVQTDQSGFTEPTNSK